MKKSNSDLRKVLIVTFEEQIANLSSVIDNVIEYDNEVVILGTDIGIKDIPLNRSAVRRVFEDYETVEHSHKVCAEEAVRLIDEWNHLKVNSKITFKDLTTYQDLPLWELYKSEILHYYLTELLYYIKIVDTVISKERPGEIILLDSKGGSARAVFRLLAGQRGIPVKNHDLKQIRLKLPRAKVVMERNYRFGKLEIKICIPFGPYRFVRHCKDLIKGMRGKLYNLRIRGKHIRKILLYSTNKKQLDSLVPLVKELQKSSQNNVLVIDWFWKSSDAIGVLKQENIPHKVFEGYMSWKIIERVRKARKTFSRNWDLLEKDEGFQKSLIFQNYCIWNLVNGYLRELFRNHFGEMVKRFEFAKQVVEKEKPDIIIVINERENIAKLCVIAGRLRGVPSLALQRGAIADFPDRDGPIYTNKMIVDGEFAYNILAKRSIDPNKLIIAGNPRYDVITERKRHFSKEKICQQLSIEVNKKIIVLTTTFLGLCVKLNEKKKLLRGTFAAMSKFPDCHLIVKLHPAELSDRLHQTIKQEVKIKNISVVKNIDLWELIFACDLLITTHSTTGSEAIFMDKPLIFVNLSKIQLDLMPYAESGAAIGVYQEEDIEGAIRNILGNKIIQEKLKIARKKFISEHLFGLDGRAASRVAKIIIEMIGQRER